MTRRAPKEAEEELPLFFENSATGSGDCLKNLMPSPAEKSVFTGVDN
jgi:hypothetical protein